MAEIKYKGKKYDKVKNLVNASKYATKWGLDRSGLYDLMDSGRITRYVILEDEYDEEGKKTGNLVEDKAFLDYDEIPPVKAYRNRPGYAPEDSVKKED